MKLVALLLAVCYAADPSLAAVMSNSAFHQHLLMMTMMGLGFASQKIALAICLWIWSMISSPWFYIPYSIWTVLCVILSIYVERNGEID